MAAATTDRAAPTDRVVDGASHMAADGAGQAEAEAALLAAFADGDGRAATRLTDALAPRIFGLAMRMLNDRAEAEDVTQEAMLRLWRIAPRWQPGEARVSTWLYQVALNLCRDRLRRTRGRVVDLDAIPEPADAAPTVVARLQEDSRARALHRALATLPDRQRQAVVLRHLEELSNPEIAAIMEISVEAVESLTARGKRALAAELERQKGELGYSDDRP
jgi:RNA polymerase sigma factor (sigma-70 family)